MGSGSSCIVFPPLFCCNFSNLLSKIQVLVKLSHKPLILSLPTTLVTVKMLSIGFLLHFGNFSVVLKRRNIFFQWIGLNLHSFSLFILLIFVVFILCSSDYFVYTFSVTLVLSTLICFYPLLPNYRIPLQRKGSEQKVLS